MLQKQSGVLNGAEGRPFLYDYTYDDKYKNQAIVIFCHGFKGFKDWGTFNAIAEHFALEGFCFLKFNFSWNGTTIDHPIDFDDLEAFGRNTFSKEIADIAAVELAIQSNSIKLPSTINRKICHIIGHSKGGAMAVLYLGNHEENRIQKVVTWASPIEFLENWSKAYVDKWKYSGVVYLMNTRTQQNMPLYLDIYKDLQLHKDEYDLYKIAPTITIPWLIVHGSKDEAVKRSNARAFKNLCQHAELKIIKQANHTFGGTHPFLGFKLPEHLLEVIDNTITFLR